MTTKTKQEGRLASPVTVWECSIAEYDGSGGIYGETKYVKTPEEALIYKRKGYTVTKHTEII